MNPDSIRIANFYSVCPLRSVPLDALDSLRAETRIFRKSKYANTVSVCVGTAGSHATLDHRPETPLALGPKQMQYCNVLYRTSVQLMTLKLTTPQNLKNTAGSKKQTCKKQTCKAAIV